MKRHPVALANLLLLAVFTFWSCNDDDISPGGFDLDYFPLEVGSYIIYELDSTVFDDFNDVVNHRILQVREIIESTFIDAGGNEAYRVERQYRDDEMSTWGSAGFDIWSANFDGNNAERVEENQRYIKIAFPVWLGKCWDGNIHINVNPGGPLSYLEDWEYCITALDEPLSIGGMNFDSTMIIVQQEEGTVIDTVGAREIYAKGIGLIFKELWVLESQCTDCPPNDTECIQACQDSLWIDRAERGFVMKQTILEYGML